MQRIYFNKCYLQAWWISDLCNVKETRVKQKIYVGEIYEPTRSFSIYEKVFQEKQDANSWRIWEKFLTTNICNKES